MQEIKISTPFIKLDQLLKYSDLCSSGAEAKMLIINGLVKLNGEVERQRGKKIKNGDIIELDNVAVKVIGD